MNVRTVENRDEWNGLARGFAACDVRQSWQWGELRASQGWRPLRLAAEAGGECVAAASVLVRRVPFLGVVGYAPRGPLLDPAHDNAWDGAAALAAGVRARTGATFLRVSPSAPETEATAWSPLERRGFRRVADLWSVWNTPRNVMTLDLAPHERALLAAMARKRRQHISTAGKKGVSAELASGLPALRAIHALLVEHGRRSGFPVAPWAHYAALHRLFDPEGELALVLGRVHGELAGAAVGVRFGPIACLMYAVTTPAAHSLPVGDVMHWEWIRWAKAAGCRTVDFGSSCTNLPPTPSHPNYGIYRFKAELGARLTMTTWYYDAVFSPLRYHLGRALEQRVLPRARRATIAAQRALRARRRAPAATPLTPQHAVPCS